jgi:hypothetical protein
MHRHQPDNQKFFTAQDLSGDGKSHSNCCQELQKHYTTPFSVATNNYTMGLLVSFLVLEKANVVHPYRKNSFQCRFSSDWMDVCWYLQYNTEYQKTSTENFPPSSTGRDQKNFREHSTKTLRRQSVSPTPRPLSVILTEPSACRIMSTLEANPACASSIALSSTSYTCTT